MEIKHLFANFGGHSQAAGMTIAKENLGDIKTFLQNRIKERYMHLIGKPVLTIDHKISLADMIVDNVNELMQFAPFGLENEEPLFLLEAIPTQIRQIGQDNRHLKLQFSHNNGIVEAIGFNFGRFAPYISQDVTVSIVGELQLNEWNGNVTVQMNIKDLAVDEWQLFDYRGKRHVSYVLPYVNHYKHNVIVCHSTDDVKDFATIENVDVITYDMDIQFINKTDVLYIYDLPNNLQQLKKVLFHTKPQSVHVAYDVKEDAFLHSIPTREQFKAVYVYLATYRSVALRQHLPHMVKILKLRKELINFILRVFHDLQFISVEDNVVTLNQDVEKKALTKSKTYQERLTKSEVERVLYYSTYDELKQWINEHSMQAFEEELTYGL